MAWYSRERRDLPWRRTKDAYAIWLSEIMLQQTRVETVVPYYHRFLAEFPTVHALAEAPLESVLARWSGLGYYRRARMLHAGARAIATRGAAFPDTVDALREVPGVGAYTAGAVASIAFGRRAALVDGNVLRVLARLFAVEDEVTTGRGRARIWALAEKLVPAESPGEWNQALMELGATICVPHAPRCSMCPVRAVCAARARGLERELPRIAKKKPPVVVHRAALVATRGERVLFARRRDGGVFAGMWEPPSVDAARATAAGDEAVALLGPRFADLVRAPVRSLARAGAIVHVLSHLRMEVDVYNGRLGGRAGGDRGRGGGDRTRQALPPGGDYDAFEWLDPVTAASSSAGSHGVTTFARKILAVARLGE